MNAKVIKVEQADGFVSLTLDRDASLEIEKAGEFEPTSVFDTATGGVEFNLFTDEFFKVGDMFVDGQWEPCEKSEKPSEKMKTQGLGWMYRTLDRLNSEEA
jgi:hypothetical protein